MSGRELAVAGERGEPGRPQLAVGLGRLRARLLALGVRLGPRLLLGHERAEAVRVHAQALLGGHLEGEVDREAVRVVQLERAVPAQRGAPARARVPGGDVEDLRARDEGAPERLLLAVRDRRDPVPVALDLGVGRLHRVPAHGQQLRQHRVGDAEQAHRAHHAAQQPAQDVAARLVPGRHAVGHQHQAGPDVVRDDAHPDVVGVPALSAVRLARQLGGAVQHADDLVDLVQVVDALQQGRDALQPHAGVDVLAGQVGEDVEVVLGADRGQLLLHEHEVPDLQEPVLVDDRAAFSPVRRPAVVVDLAAGPARSGDAHVPVVVEQPAALDPLLRQPRDAGPQRGRLVVGVQHGDPDAVRVEAEEAVVLAAGDELPGEADGLGLEVVAEGEVALHLEEGAVPGGLADLLDVEGADALLHRRRPVPWRGLGPGEVGLEGHHPRVHEQQGRVVVEQRCRRHHLVAARGEVVQEAAPDLGGSHSRWSFEEWSGGAEGLRGRGSAARQLGAELFSRETRPTRRTGHAARPRARRSPA